MSTTFKGRRISAIWFLLLFLLTFVGWASFFELDQQIRAQGVVIPSSRTQVIQAVDGGSVRAIYVREGETVKSGQKLALLEDDRAKAAHAQAKAEVFGRKAALIRCLAELAGKKPIFPKEFNAYPQFVDAQVGYYEQRKRGLDDELAVQTAALKLAKEEYNLSERLGKSGDISRVEVMRSLRQVLDIESRISGLRNKYLQEAYQEMVKVEEDLSSSRYKLDEKVNILDHTEMFAPLTGIIKYVRVTTIGGVLKPGDELMQISPIDEEILAEVKINPTDVGQLRIGLPVSLRLDAFDYSIYGKLEGTLRYISPDTLSEPAPNGQQQIFYRAQVAINDMSKQKGSKIRVSEIIPGMVVTADILTGHRSVLHYLLKPVYNAFDGALSQK
jgi:adhesin transport system membrane fusion protein